MAARVFSEQGEVEPDISGGPQPPGGALQHIHIVCSLQLIAFEVDHICILKINRCLSNV